MTSDIVERLLDSRDDKDCDCCRCDGAKEIQRLRTALALAVGELSTHDVYRVWSPAQLLEQFIEEGRRIH